MTKKVDRIDDQLLRILQNNSDISMQELGKKVGLSHTPCWRRVKRLEEKGLIAKRVTLLDAIALDLSVNVFVNVSMRSHHQEIMERFESQVAEIPQIVECYSISGDTDYLLRVVVSNVQEYEHLLKSKLVHLPDVGNLNSTFALSQIKYTTELPIPQLETIEEF